MIKIWFRDIESGKWIQAGFSFDSGHEDIVEFFIDKKVDVNQRDFFNFTALHYAASKGNSKKDFIFGVAANSDIKYYICNQDNLFS